MSDTMLSKARVRARNMVRLPRKVARLRRRRPRTKIRRHSLPGELRLNLPGADLDLVVIARPKVKARRWRILPPCVKIQWEALKIPLEQLFIEKPSCDFLRENGIYTMRALVAMTFTELLSQPGANDEIVEDIQNALRNERLWLGMKHLEKPYNCVLHE